MVATTDGFELAERDLEIRGEGQLLGARQSGLSDLRFTRLRQDIGLLERARAAAAALADEGLLARRGRDAARRRPPRGRREDHRRRAPRRQDRRPEGDSTRPTGDRVREAAYNLIGPVDDAAVLDLFAGSGAMGLEALSRGARRCVFVESDRAACAVIRDNLEKLRLTGALVLAEGRLPGAARGARRGTHLRSRARRPAVRRVAGARAAPRRGAAGRARPTTALLVVETSARIEPELPLTVVTSRRYGSARITALHPMITAICPGSYDPVTLGHLDVIGRAAATFDRVVVGVVREPHHKQTLFTVEERVAFLEEALAGHRQRHRRRLPRARRRLRAQARREDDGEGPARDRRLRVGVPDEPAQPPARAGDRDDVRDVEPAVQLHLVQRREGDRVVRRKSGRACARGRGPPLPGVVPERPTRRPLSPQE